MYEIDFLRNEPLIYEFFRNYHVGMVSQKHHQSHKESSVKETHEIVFSVKLFPLKIWKGRNYVH